MFSVNVSFCQVNNLMLLHIWDLLSQPEQCSESTLIPFVGCVQLFFPAFNLAPVMWSCNLWVRLGAPWSGSSLPCCVLKGLCGQRWLLVRRRGVGAAWFCPSSVAAISPARQLPELQVGAASAPHLPSPTGKLHYLFLLLSVTPNGEEIREPQ